MGLGYTYNNSCVIIGSKDSSDSITTEELENSYDADATKSFATGGMSKINLLVQYTMGASETANTLEIRVRASEDNTNFFQFVTESTSGGTSTLEQREFIITGTNGGDHLFSLPLDIISEYIEVAFKESGVSSNKGGVFCEVVLGGDK